MAHRAEMPDWQALLPSLPAETQAQFDMLTSLIVVNVSKEDYLQAFMRYAKNTSESDNQLICAINHETYHFFQLVSSGFLFHHMTEMIRIIGTRPKHAGDLQTLEKHRIFGDAVVNLVKERQQLNNLKVLDPSVDLSVDDATVPQVYPALELLEEKIKAPTEHGLSALDLVEGSTIVYQQILTFGRENLESTLDIEWPDYDGTYRRAYDFVHSICGDRTVEIILPATALALRYTNPPEAFPLFVSQLTAAPPGQESAKAHSLASDPPEISKAGRYLGTAMDVRKDQSTYPYAFYDSALNDLHNKQSGIDEIDLLTDPKAAGKFGSLSTLGFVTRDGVLFGGSDDDVAMRLLLCGIGLRSLSLHRYIRRAEQRLSETERVFLEQALGSTQHI